MPELTINEVQLDYMTITSSCDEWYKIANDLGEHISENWEERSRMQYTGKLRRGANGTYFLGTGEQEKGTHHILQVDGGLCHDIRFHLFNFFPAYFVRCTRLDIQITLKHPEKWSQWEYLVRMRDKVGEALVSYPRPSTERGQLMQTVYVGRREGSDRFLRVYVKLDHEDNKLLRIETEIKRKRANVIYQELCRNQWPEDFTRIAHPEILIQTQKDARLQRLVHPFLEGHHRPLKIKTQDGNTADWIINTAMPTIDRHIRAHGSIRVEEIEDMLLKTVEYIVWRKYK